MENSNALAIPVGARLEVITEAGGWRLDLRPAKTAGASVTATSDREPAASLEPQSLEPQSVEPMASRWLAEQLAEPTDPLLDNGFRLQRFGRPTPVPPAGERVVLTAGTANRSVVGERLVVTWLPRMDDAEHPALRALRQLELVGFDGIPPTYGALTWQAPSGRELPCALVTGFLAGAVDGWQWCVASVESGDRPGFPAELGRLTARLHVALGSPSSLLPLPMLAVGGAQVRAWHAQARLRFDELAEQIGGLDDLPTATDGNRVRLAPSAILGENLKPMESVVDRLLDLPGRTPVQLIHGDLHVGQMLSWAGGLSVIDFDGHPVPGTTTARQPAARDVARLLVSLDQVGRIVDRRSGFTRTAEINDWSIAARADFLAAYRGELETVERRDVLDTRLLPSFLVEQAVRNLLYAVRFRPSWAYATIDGLETILNDLPEPDPAVNPQF